MTATAALAQPLAELQEVECARDPGAAYHAVKRGVDVVLAVVLLLLAAPIVVVVAVAIKLDTSGPIIFAQERVGARRRVCGGRTTWTLRTFRLLKFRSMVDGADPSVHEAYVKLYVEGVHVDGRRGPAFKLADDARVTRVGRTLRKLSLDELPQLVNVLAGDMSLVGPRPVPIYEVACYEAEHRERLAALPGISGLWQVSGRCDVPFDEMARLDIWYVRRRSLWLDCKILLRTIPAVLTTRGAG